MGHEPGGLGYKNERWPLCEIDALRSFEFALWCTDRVNTGMSYTQHRILQDFCHEYASPSQAQPSLFLFVFVFLPKLPSCRRHHLLFLCLSFTTEDCVGQELRILFIGRNDIAMAIQHLPHVPLAGFRGLCRSIWSRMLRTANGSIRVKMLY